jgi:hypothetical protein
MSTAVVSACAKRWKPCPKRLVSAISYSLRSASSICSRGAKSTGASKATLTMSSPIRMRLRRTARSLTVRP